LIFDIWASSPRLCMKFAYVFTFWEVQLSKRLRWEIQAAPLELQMIIQLSTSIKAALWPGNGKIRNGHEVFR
jgi:hypothetical protein